LRESSASRATIVSYPPDRVLTFDEYVEIANEHIGDDAIVVGESFSGPIAIRVAARRRVAAIVLVSSFVVAPMPNWFASLPRVDAVVAVWMVGFDRAKRKAFRDAVRTVDPRVIDSRLRIALAVDERESLRKTTAPLLDLRATRDVLGGSRKAVLEGRPDAHTAEIDGPHGLLLARTELAWKVIASWSATIADTRRPSAGTR